MNPPASAVTATPPTKNRLSYAWRALKHRNFRLFFSGQTISLMGTWMTRLATSWLVYKLTGSAFLLGVVGFAGQIPTFLFAPFAGVWVDRLNRRSVLVVTQVLAMLQSLALAALTLTNRINIQEIIVLSAFQGLINAFDMPGRQTFLVEMIEDKQDLGNAIALNSSMVNLARLVGPSLAGAVIAISSEGYCFLIDGISYLAVILSLLLMRLSVKELKRSADSMLKQLSEGWTYVSSPGAVRIILLLFALVSLMGWPFTVLMPIFAAKYSARRAAYAGLFDGGCGSRGADLGDLAGDSADGPRPGENDLHLYRGFRSWTYWFRFVQIFLVVDAFDAGVRLRHDAADGGEQHDHSNRGGRQQARQGDELLYRGVRGDGAVWQLAGGRFGSCHRRTAHGNFQRRLLSRRRGLVYLAASGHSRMDSAGLPGLGNSSSGRTSDGVAGQRGGAG